MGHQSKLLSYGTTPLCVNGQLDGEAFKFSVLLMGVAVDISLSAEIQDAKEASERWGELFTRLNEGAYQLRKTRQPELPALSLSGLMAMDVDDEDLVAQQNLGAKPSASALSGLPHVDPPTRDFQATSLSDVQSSRTRPTNVSAHAQASRPEGADLGCVGPPALHSSPEASLTPNGPEHDEQALSESATTENFGAAPRSPTLMSEHSLAPRQPPALPSVPSETPDSSDNNQQALLEPASELALAPAEISQVGSGDLVPSQSTPTSKCSPAPLQSSLMTGSPARGVELKGLTTSTQPTSSVLVGPRQGNADDDENSVLSSPLTSEDEENESEETVIIPNSKKGRSSTIVISDDSSAGDQEVMEPKVKMKQRILRRLPVLKAAQSPGKAGSVVCWR